MVMLSILELVVHSVAVTAEDSLLFYFLFFATYFLRLIVTLGPVY